MTAGAYTWRREWETPMKLLHQDGVRAYAEGMRRCWWYCASPMSREHIVQFVDGWVYVRGPEMDEAAKARLDSAVAHAQSFLERGEHLYDAELKPKVVEIATRLRKHPKPTRPLPELVAHLEECLEGHGELMGNLHWQLASSAIAGSSGPLYVWPKQYAEITGRPESEASVLVGGIANEMNKTVRSLRKLARIVQEEGRDSERFAKHFRALIRRHGHRTGNGWGSASNTFDAPTWNIRPDIPMQMIETYARSDLDAIDRKERDAKAERKRLLRDVRKQLKGDPDRLALLEEALAAAKYHSYLLEDHNDWIDQTAAGVLRDAEHIVGLRLVADGLIDEPEDVAHLSLAELKDMPFDVRPLIAERKAEYEAQAKLDPPKHLGEAPPEGPNWHDEGEGQVGGELRGIAASPGRYTGRARVFMPSPIPPDVDDGDILVAKDAGPDWTPVFAVLGGVVLDVGASWQHAAVVAREFGIPAVTGTKVGTEVIVDGATITVDGTAGTVQLA